MANYVRFNHLDSSAGALVYIVVNGGDSWSEGHGFESQHHVLDGHFSHLFVVKIVIFVGKDKKLKRGR